MSGSDARIAGRAPTARRLAQAWAAPGIAFAATLALALRGGGFDVVLRSEVGIGAWAILLVGAAFGVLPLFKFDRRTWTVLGLLAALLAWILLGLLWTESDGRTFDESARLAGYLGIFALILALQGPDGPRRTILAVGAAIGIVATLALLSRLHPAWFPPNDLAAAQPALQGRLNYPLNYWNGVAALIAIGAPIVLAVAAHARHRLAVAFATAALPIMVLAIYFTFSRGGAIAAAVGVALFAAVSRRRLEIVATLVPTAAGSAALVFAASRRDALDAGLADQAARSQGDEMILIVLAVCAGVVGARFALERLLRARVRVPKLSRRQLTRFAIPGAAIAVVLGALLASPRLSESWEAFKQPAAVEGGADRFATASGNGRYQYWGAALDAFESEPLTGIGAGTYQLWWTRNGSIEGKIRDAHSLYLETLGETGAIGLLILVGAIGMVVAAAIRRVREADDWARSVFAAALAAIAAFLVAAGTDWLWEIPVIPIAFLFLASAVIAAPAAGASRRSPQGASWRTRLAIGVAGIGSLFVLGIALETERALREGTERLAAADIDGALAAAEEASSLQPFAARPYSVRAGAYELLAQRNLAEHTVNEAAEPFERAADAARAATEREPTNWETWMTLGRIEQRRGRVAPSIEAYAEGRSLNPLNDSLNYLDDLIDQRPRPRPDDYAESLPPATPPLPAG